MGRVSGPATQDRLGLDGESALPRDQRPDHQGRRLPPRLRHRPVQRRHSQGDDPHDDLADQGRPHGRLLQQAIG